MSIGLSRIAPTAHIVCDRFIIVKLNMVGPLYAVTKTVGNEVSTRLKQCAELI